ncbi:peptide ABC transporter ATP-binding protein [Candidatus Marsarchaeota G2 archaeon ECH_B_SAG-G16]|uniref:Peptide ABC transporter ATP-binding protein n=1 Tax=Candidatus Marsarchaeota G2 archaeon ECH_B_SAG-G16 TaxID=1978167 RepID=A0A2R6C1H3_9ARCH|nr:MAG: peptide ABC transporter ATP-binding protein [Candidatus Marsarchaeota G2 archaeon ECH_B_SAG-G16]
MEPTLQVESLRTYFYTEAGVVKAVDDVSFSVRPSTIHALVGESGSGKTVTAQSILRIVPKPGRIVGGRIVFEGRNLLDLDERQMRMVRGRRISLIQQDPTATLDPMFTIQDQLVEAIMVTTELDREQAKKKARKLLEDVKIPGPENVLKSYPHQLSGGMRQRVAIARALAGNPKVLIADEPTTALDVTIQAQILELMRSLRDEYGLSIILITHDLGIVAQVADEVTVMYAGKVCESGSVDDIFHSPLHPYTQALLLSVPRVDKRIKLRAIPGNIPDLVQPPQGCRFHPRCPYAVERCSQEEPGLEKVGSQADHTLPSRSVYCHRFREIKLEVV